MAGKRSSHVPQQYLGYAMQATRLLTRLIDAGPGAVASLEVLDDVAVMHSDGTVVAEQGKSTLSRNPIADRSVELWKTLSNWVDQVVAKNLDPSRTAFVLYVSRLRSGNLISAFHEAITTVTANKAIDQAIETLWGPAPSHPKRARVGSTLRPFVNNCFDQRTEFRQVIEHLCLACGDGDAYQELDFALKRIPHREETYTQLRDGLLGWCKRRLEEMISSGLPAIIEYREFEATFLSLSDKLAGATHLGALVPQPENDAIAREIQLRRYIRQLHLIEADEGTLVAAASTFLKASAVRTDWATRGIIYPDSFDEYRDELVAAWRTRGRTIEILHRGYTEPERGWLLFGECIDYRTLLQGKEVPNYFIQGSYHALADNLEVGWHPNYQELLET